MKQYYVTVFKTDKGISYRVWVNYPGKDLPDDTTHFFLVYAESEIDAMARLLMGEGHTLLSPEGKSLKMV